MKQSLFFTVATMAAASLLAADSTPKDDLIAAAKALAAKGYSWKMTIETGNFSNTSEGQADKDGVVHFSLTFGDNTTEVFFKGEKGAVKLPDQDWQSLADLTADNGGQRGRGRFMGRMLRNLKAPAAQVEELAGKTKEIRKEGSTYTAELTEAAIKDLLSFGGRRGGNAPDISNAKGTVRISLRDGLLSKYELKLQATMTFNGQDQDISPTTTIEIRGVGRTSLDVPPEAKEKLS
jgi:hypothetical protein